MVKKTEQSVKLPMEDFDLKHGLATSNDYKIKEKNPQKEELIQRDEVENTPFIMITINNETFGTFGKYRITEMYHTKAQCKVELLKMDWNRVIQIMTLIVDMMRENTKTTK